MKKTPIEIDPESGLHILRGRIIFNGPKTGQIEIYCPFCKRNHYHGWLDGITPPEYLEHYICHCVDNTRRRPGDSPFREHGYLVGIDPDAEHTLPS